ncbi:MAG: DUF1566 domain-containing protein [Myxococcota bacterium]|nr:DUF1566 domain-containing protein [Myxococcota bacterium]
MSLSLTLRSWPGLLWAAAVVFTSSACEECRAAADCDLSEICSQGACVQPDGGNPDTYSDGWGSTDIDTSLDTGSSSVSGSETDTGTQNDPGLDAFVTPDAMEHAEAILFCDDLTHDDAAWHLPNVNELRSLMVGCGELHNLALSDPGCLGEECNDDYGGCPQGKGPGEFDCYWAIETELNCADKWFWSNSQVTNKLEDFWVMNFSQTLAEPSNDRNLYWVVCVRSLE